MKLTINTTYTAVLLLTVCTALTATFAKAPLLVPIIVTLSLIKFWLVVFHFMELKKGNIFWKVLIIIFGAILGLILVLLL